MVIRSKTIRIVIFVCTLLIAAIIFIQLFWLQKIYLYEEKLFNINVSKSIKSIYSQMQLVNDASDNVQKVVENPSPDVYLLRIDCSPTLTNLWQNLKSEFINHNVYSDCKAGIYNADKKEYTVQNYIDLPDAYNAQKIEIKLPVIPKDYSYILLYFPHREQYIIKQMLFWIVSSTILLLILIGMGACIYYLYRQKFYYETQKDFINNFTHEFKTPLAVIKIAADVLKQENIVQKPDKLKNYAGIIQEQTSHLQAQVQRLLETAYTNKTSLPLSKEKFDANDLLNEAINDLQPLIEQKKAQIETHFENSIAMIEADKAYIRQTYFNLIENALKYSLNPIVNINTNKNNHEFSFSIKDNGIGIEEDKHKKIFNQFYRVTDGNIHTAQGFGLGLNFVKKVIDAHNGKINVKSTKGIGSTFIVKIPSD